jgi:hypothetical protein
VVVNICTGNEQHKAAILMSAPIMSRMFSSLDADDAQIRVAAVWCLINLTWPDDSGKWLLVAALMIFSKRFSFRGSRTNKRVMPERL